MINKKALREQIIQIALMTSQELKEHAQKISRSAFTRDEQSYLFRAIDIVKEMHGDTVNISPLVVSASISAD